MNSFLLYQSIHGIEYLEGLLYNGKSNIARMEEQVVALTFMALDFLLQIQLDMKEELPLISCNDVKLMMANSLDNKLNSIEGIMKAINLRHQKRAKDLLFSANST